MNQPVLFPELEPAVQESFPQVSSISLQAANDRCVDRVSVAAKVGELGQGANDNSPASPQSLEKEENNGTRNYVQGPEAHQRNGRLQPRRISARTEGPLELDRTQEPGSSGVPSRKPRELRVQESFPQVSAVDEGNRAQSAPMGGVALPVRFGGAAESVKSTAESSSPEHGLARNSDPETSHLAANSVDVNGLQLKVLEVLRANKLGLTAEELADRLRLPLNSISPRTRPMVAKGLIYDSGHKRLTSGNRLAIIWRAYV